MQPVRVGARELKTRLGTYLAQVRRGQRLLVTERRAPVAELRPIEPAPSSRSARLRRLASLGLVTSPARTLAPFVAVIPTPSPRMSAQALDREGRF